MAARKKTNTRKKTIKSPETSVRVVNKNKRFVLGKLYETNFFKLLVLSSLFIFLAFTSFYLFKRFNVAKVNGQYINQIEFYKELEKREGNNVLDDLITKKIIYQEADKLGIQISIDDVNQEVSKLREEIEKSGSTLENVMVLQGITYDDLLENIRIQKILESVLKDKVSISDEEVQKAVDENKDFYSEGTNMDDVKQSLRTQLFQEKLASEYRTWIQNKKAESTIEYLR